MFLYLYQLFIYSSVSDNKNCRLIVLQHTKYAVVLVTARVGWLVHVNRDGQGISVYGEGGNEMS